MAIRYPASILYKSIAGRYRPVSYLDGPTTARYRFIKNASWVVQDIYTMEEYEIAIRLCKLIKASLFSFTEEPFFMVWLNVSIESHNMCKFCLVELFDGSGYNLLISPNMLRKII